MAKCAVLYVPKKEDKFYELGTSILGYDVRARVQVPIAKELQDLQGFDPDWVRKAQQYGFHLTIGNAIDFVGNLFTIEKEIADIVACFHPDHCFTLKKCTDFVTQWGEAVVLRYDPNDFLKILHTLIVARVNPLGNGSGYLERYLSGIDHCTEQCCHHKIMKFYSPYVFDSYLPHFTLLSPYTGQDYQSVEQLFSSLFSDFSCLKLDSVCLVIQMHEGENWKIYKEFDL